MKKIGKWLKNYEMTGNKSELKNIGDWGKLETSVNIDEIIFADEIRLQRERIAIRTHNVTPLPLAVCSLISKYDGVEKHIEKLKEEERRRMRNHGRGRLRTSSNRVSARATNSLAMAMIIVGIFIIVALFVHL